MKSPSRSIGYKEGKVLRRFSLRKRIIFIQLILFVGFYLALFPFVDDISARLVRDSLIESTQEVRELLIQAKTEEELIQLLKKQEYSSFFRMSIINDRGYVIYDTHVSKKLGGNFVPYKPMKHGEVEEAFKKGVGYDVAISDTFGGKFAYVAETFPFQGKTYVFRTSFPFKQIEDLTEHFEWGILIFSFSLLLLFNALIWFIFSRLTKPIREIIQMITPYQKGETEEFPKITLTSSAAGDGDVQKLASVFNQLSKRIQEQIEILQREKNEKGAILESLGEGVVAVDGNMHVLYINFIACKMLGLSRKTLLGNPLQGEGEKVNRELLEKAQFLLKQCQEKNTILTESHSFGADKKIFIDLVAAPKAEGTGAIVVLQDKTSHYRVLEMGKDFVANASHELRTPITIIKGFAETLHDMPDIDKKMYTEITEKIGRNCERMENLVNNLLTLADIENLPESRFAECDLIVLIENCRHMLRSVYSDARVQIEKKQETLKIRADSGLLELAFINILDNAAKYSTAPAHITITIDTADEEEAIVQIQDRGRGIPKEDLDHIFERFYRVDKTHSRRLGGAGLGLSIVKTIIEKHDGAIEVESELEKGTTFTIWLPLRHHSRL